MGDGQITLIDFGRAVPDHFTSACFEVPISPRSDQEPSIISSTADKLKTLTGTKHDPVKTPIAVFGNHNLAYYYWHLSRARGHLKGDAVLLHLDAHSDIKSAGPRQFPPDDSYPLDAFQRRAQWLTIANFIGDATFSGLVGEFDWILPDWAQEDTIVGEYYWSYHQGVMTASSPDENIIFGHCINGDGFEVLPIRDMFDCERIERTFLLNKSYKEQLPNVGGKDVILDIDLDWFCNSGWDSGTFLRSIKSDCDAGSHAKVDELLKALSYKNIRPASVTIATSPDYMFTEDADDVLYALVEGLVEYGIVDEPDIIIGPPAYSMNSQYYARSLFNFAYDNMTNDLRLVSGGTEGADFNDENMVCELTMLDERKGYLHKRVKDVGEDSYYPGKQNATDVLFSCRRGDYSQYISIAYEYGYTTLGRVLERLEQLQSDEEADPAALRSAYETVLYLTRTMTGHLRDAMGEPAVLY